VELMGEVAAYEAGTTAGVGILEQSTEELLQAFEGQTLAKADPEWLVNDAPSFKLVGSELVVNKQVWKLAVPQDAAGSPLYGAKPAEGAHLEKQFETAGAGKVRVLGPDGRPVELRQTVERTTRAGADRTLEALAVRTQHAEHTHATELVRFVPPTQPAIIPAKAIVLVDVSGQAQGSFEMSREDQESKVPLIEGGARLSIDDLRRVWEAGTVTGSPLLGAYLGRWEGRPLMEDLTLPHPVGFTHQVWIDDREGIVGTCRLRPREHHGAMKLSVSPIAIRIELRLKGLVQEVRAFTSNPQLMLCRLGFAVRDREGKPLDEATRLYVSLMGDTARGAQLRAPEELTRREVDGTTWLDFYYVAVRKSPTPDPTEVAFFKKARLGL
jgi:hypothetical protein